MYANLTADTKPSQMKRNERYIHGPVQRKSAGGSMVIPQHAQYEEISGMHAWSLLTYLRWPMNAIRLLRLMIQCEETAKISK